MHIDILTLFPDMLLGTLNHSILKRANDAGHFQYDLVNFRDFSQNKHKKVDDYPYGGGAGMVLTAQPIYDAVDFVTSRQNQLTSRIILMCPQGEVYTQKKAEELSKEKHLVIICGHYEGYDERIRNIVTDEVSIGDYVLTSGEIGAQVIVDSVVRLLPEVLGNEISAKEDSFTTGLLEHPHYTRPAEFRGKKVPDVLLQGNHKEIDKWRHEQALKRTFIRRPDLLKNLTLSESEQAYIDQLKNTKK